MRKSPGANLYAHSPTYPYLPPWCLLSSPQVATLLNVTPETLHSWRVLESGPEPVSTAVIRPTQGNPTYYRLAQVRKWASERIGLSYKIQDQVIDFLLDFFPESFVTKAPLDAQVRLFDDRLDHDRHLHRRGREPEFFELDQILEWDSYISRQPRFTPSKYKYRDLDFAILVETPREHLHYLKPRQLDQYQKSNSDLSKQAS